MLQERNINKTYSKRRALCRLFGRAAVSVILPVYNTEAYLRQCLDSLLAQSFEDFELLCFNDGSTDNSAAILEEYKKRDKRIRVITQENIGVGATRNKGLEAAKGKYILFLDSDDWFEADMLRASYEKAEETDADIVLFGYRAYYAEQNTESEMRGLNTEIIGNRQVFSRHDIPDRIMDVTHANAWTKLYKRRFIQKSGLEYQSLPNAEDEFFTFATLCVAERIACVNEAFVHYRYARKGSLESNKHLHPLCFIEADLALYEELNRRGIYQEVEHAYINHMITHIDYVIWKLRDTPEAKQSVITELKASFIPRVNLFGYPDEIYRDKERYKKIKTLLN